MVNWILGHTQRFKALVSHAGVYDLRAMFGATEELWFPLWEFGGTPWDKPEEYAKWSPSHFVKEFKTPTLVIHGELDYRVPYKQGLQLFTALQMQKVPSKLLLFPDEGHWVLKPQNSLLWYKTVHRLARFLGKKVKAIIIVVVLLVLGVSCSVCDVRRAPRSPFSPPSRRSGSARRSACRSPTRTGCGSVRAWIEQNGAQQVLLEQAAKSSRLMFWRKHEQPRHVHVRRGQDQGAESEGRQGADRGGDRFERPARAQGHGVGGCQRGADRAARDPGRPPALHQPGRDGAGYVQRDRVLHRGGRAGRQVHVPQLPAAGQGAGAAFRHVRLLRGTWAGREAGGVRAQPRGHRSDRDVLVQALPEELPDPADRGRREADGKAGDVRRSDRAAGARDGHRRALQQDQHGDPGAEQQAACRPAVQDGGEDPLERAVHPLGQGRGDLRRRPRLDVTRARS